MSIIVNQIIKKRRPKPNYPILSELSKRFSPRHFSNEQIPEVVMHKIFEAARWVPSAYNAQPWSFYWTRNGNQSFNKILTALPNLNSWAKTSAVLVVGCFLVNKEKGKSKFAVYDLGASVLAIILQAQHLGYYARQIGLFDNEKLRQIIHVKKEEQPYVIIALGKLGDYTKATEDIIRRDLTPTPRKSNIAKQIR